MSSRIERLAERLLQLRLEQAGVPQWDPLPHQHPPDDPDWFFWLLEAGRGAGKTATASRVLADHLNGPPCISGDLPHRAAIIAPTLGDAIESASLTDMALVRQHPRARFRQSGGGSMVIWPNKSQVRLFGTHTKEDVNRLRAGGNRCFVWAEEVAAWRYLEDAWSDMMFGLRLGPNPRIIGTTTPRPRPEYKTIRATADLISHATTLDNPNLNEAQRLRLLEMYEGTSTGEQELFGKLIDEAEGAIWTTALIEDGRLQASEFLESIDAEVEDEDEHDYQLQRVVVAIDPPGGATEAGIVVAAAVPWHDGRLHFAVLEDLSGKFTPEKWAARAVGGYRSWSADRIVGETNYGGDMVKSVLRNVDPSIPYRPVRATRGKAIRAEPIKALYEQGRVHHIGRFEKLEEEMVQWVPDESEWSPNRLDALVWALTELSGRRPWKVG